MSLLHAAPVNFDLAWVDLQQCLTSMVSDCNQGLSHEEWLKLYTNVYKICTNPAYPQAEALYFRIKSTLETHLLQTHEKLSTNLSDVSFLKEYCTTFHSYYTGMKYAAELFSYLNRYWVRTTHCETGQAPIPGVYPVLELSLHLWIDIVSSRFRERILFSVQNILRDARDHRRALFDFSDVISDVVQTYITLGSNEQDPLQLYREDFEAHLISSTSEYYRKLSLLHLADMSVSEYLKTAQELCKLEEKRAEILFHRITVPQIMTTCYSSLIEAHVDELCADVESFMNEDQRDDLHLLFSLLSMLPREASLMTLKDQFRKHVVKKGMEMVQSIDANYAMKHPEEYIESLLKMRQKYYDLTNLAFDSHPLMRTALDQACRVFSNHHPHLPNLLAKHIHILLEKGRSSVQSSSLFSRMNLRASTTKKRLPSSSTSTSPPPPPSSSSITCASTPALSSLPSCSTSSCLSASCRNDHEIEQEILNISVIFGLLENKDIFKAYYAKLLAKRLIYGTSRSDELEAQMIRKLGEICGCDFVSKLQRMCHDKTLSKDMHAKFVEWNSEKAALRSEVPFFNALVLTAGAWPMQTTTLEDIPVLSPPLQGSLNDFRLFYESQSTGRRLHWLFPLSQAEVKATCFHKRYDFTCSLYQTAVLLEFNERENVSMNSLCEELHVSREELERHVQGLVKIKLLRLHEDALSFNANFTHRRARLHLLPLLKIETETASIETQTEVLDDRKMVVQAAIVRILKTRKKLTHTQVVAEVIGMLKDQFVPSVTIIKENVEILIEKDYLRRMEGTMATYVYVA